MHRVCVCVYMHVMYLCVNLYLHYTCTCTCAYTLYIIFLYSPLVWIFYLPLQRSSSQPHLMAVLTNNSVINHQSSPTSAFIEMKVCTTIHAVAHVHQTILSRLDYKLVAIVEWLRIWLHTPIIEFLLLILVTVWQKKLHLCGYTLCM